MYTYEQRILAVNLYQKYGRRVAPVIRELGFLDRHMLVKWVKEYESTGDLHNCSKREPKFSESEKKLLIDLINYLLSLLVLLFSRDGSRSR